MRRKSKNLQFTENRRRSQFKTKKSLPKFTVRGVLIEVITTAILLHSTKGFLQLGTPPRVKSLAQDYDLGTQIINTTRVIFRRLPSKPQIHIYDVFADDFVSRTTPLHEIVFQNNVNVILCHPQNPDLLFVGSKKIFVASLQSYSVVKSFDTGLPDRLEALGLIEDGVFVWGGGNDKILIKIDYTSSNLIPLVTGTAATERIQSISMLDPSASFEMACSLTKFKILFFDRTGSLDVGATLREFSPSRTNIDDM